MPPLRIGEVRGIKQLALRCFAPAVGSVTAGAVLIEELVDFFRSRRLAYLPALNRTLGNH